MRLGAMLLGLVSLVAGCAESVLPVSAPSGAIYEVASGQALDPDTLAQRLGRADIVVLGEVHDNPAHHAAQAWVVGALQPDGLAFEMIPALSEEGIAVFLSQGGAYGEIGPAIGWERTGWPDWEMYRPIFTAAPRPVITGGGLSRRLIHRAIASSAYLAVPDLRFQPYLAKPQPPETQAAMESEMIDAHCGKLPAKAAAGMVEAQRLRDASFAAAALRARDVGQGRAVLITGNGHARTDRGVPTYLAQVAPRLKVLSLGQIETGRPLDAAEIKSLPYDYVWLSPPFDRPDPCLAFK